MLQPWEIVHAVPGLALSPDNGARHTFGESPGQRHFHAGRSRGHRLLRDETRRSAPAAGNPLDEIFIDIDGASAQILRLEPGAPPTGQLITAPSVLRVKARDIGQVFAIGLDDGIVSDTANATSNIYFGASSAFGLQIVAPDSDGDGRPERVKKGQPDAQWMAGQFGLDKGGEPGSIYRIDGKTGAVSLFATIPGNRGPGLGDIVFDRATRQFFVSDLDTGLIHRLDEAGKLIDTFDHGVTGRPAGGLPAVADDGVVMDIKAPAFDSENSSTWGFTQPERRVWGLGLRAGRLYYAPFAGPEIWSLAINLDGTFGGDPRREIEVSGTPSNHPISDMAFDAQDHMYVAQRGGIKGSYDYSIFADAKQSVVFRFAREIPDDPVTPGIWVPIPDEYAVGFPTDHRNTSGGVTLGYGYDAAGSNRPGACDMTIWMSGDSLLDNPVTHGLQGNDRALTRPDNEPPAKTYFVDYDGRADDPRQQGHVGDVEIWQSCDQRAGIDTYTQAADLPFDYVPPLYVPPGETPPDGWQPDDTPPVGTPDWAYNLRLDKKSLPDACAAGGLGFLCDYVIRVANFGPDAYFGPIVVNDKLPAAPAGAVMTFTNAPPWFCIPISPSEQQCTYAPGALFPGESIDLHVTVDLAVAAPVCHLDNVAGLVWPPGLGDIDPADDFDLATATIPAPHCLPPAGETTNLKIWKDPFAELCTDKGPFFECKYLIVARNIGAGIYNGPIEIEDTIPAGATASFSPASWNCAGPAPTYTCERGPVVLLPNQAVNLNAVVKVPKNLAGPLSCKAENEAKIVEAVGGSSQNSDATDDEADATMILPGELAQCPDLPAMSNLKLKKTKPAGECPVIFGHWICAYKITLQNFGKAYTSPIQFLDALPFGSPAGATVSFQPPAGWNCGGPLLPNLYQCSSNNPDLAHLEKVEIPVIVKIPVAPVAKCEVTNNALIIKAPGGTLLNSFAGDDTSSAKAQLAAAFAQGICLSNLTLKKTGPAGPCPVVGTDWACTFKVTLQNFGAPYETQVQFLDSLPAGSPAGATVTFQPPAGWNCGGPFLNLYQCSSNNPNLEHQEKVEIPVTVKIPVAPLAKCEITNSAKIIKAPGGTADNFFKFDDASSAKAQLAAVFPLDGGPLICVAANVQEPQPPPLTAPEGKESNLSISKTAAASTATATGQNTKFTITVTNEGPGVYNAPIELRDTLFDGAIVEPSNGSWSDPWVCEGQSAVGHPEQGLCTHPEVELDPGESVVLELEIEAPNSFVAPSGSQVKCGYKNKAEILDPAGGTPNNTNAGDDTAFAEAKFAPFEKHGTTFCGLGLTTPPASPTCPQGWSRTPVPGKCCPPNSGWDGERCKRDVKAPEEACPSGTKLVDGKCRTPTAQPETCGPNEVGTYPNCRCARGFAGEPPNCKPRACPAGTTGKYPDCREIDCPSNQKWIDGACRCRYPLKWNGKRCVAETPKACPADSIGNYPNCRCKGGTTGVPGNCKRIVVPKTCPADSIGKYPNCRCKRGTAGEPGNCKRIVVPEKKCPEGFRGTPPNCKRVIPPRKLCPEGFRGTPPNCKRIVEPRRCPEGFRGVPPNCKRAIPLRRLCPQGFRGVPPNCTRIGTNPL